MDGFNGILHFGQRCTLPGLKRYPCGSFCLAGESITQHVRRAGRNFLLVSATSALMDHLPPGLGEYQAKGPLSLVWFNAMSC